MRLDRLGSDDPRDVLRALRAALGAGPAVALGSSAALPDEVSSGTAVVVTTSGSSGVPKSVMLSRAALTSSALATAERIGAGQWLLALPASYVAGVQVLVRSLVQGTEPAVLAGRFSPAAFAHVVSGMHSSRGGERVPTYTSLVPAQLQTLVDAADDDADVARALRSFEAILIGGQALPVALRERAAELGARIVRTYGSSETAGGCVYDGVPLDGVTVAAVDGELRISGPTLADGYLGDDELTERIFVRDDAGTRWYRTGDAGQVDDGIVRVTGRIDNVIVSGGVNVSLDRVERIVRELLDAVVVGAPDERWGETPVIVAARAGVPDPDAALAAAREAVAAQLGKPARPSRILLLDELPRLASGKPDRRALTAIAAG
ncbi:AMP-binding protein [Microbacterium paludicola]|uniref:Acyl-CoA synthetase n=1 Tax=Microbacterium paludicola TaxID=300019 RepID=A0A4Y9FVC6_9MICO|nr:AMP-binding protein [Microbacterium paludicola]MBF0816536.1 AMP-binding protein [Microbacterium paludicola]TFU32840.1 acyl-CoA synthetase [Microbacterium paludicola]